MQKHPVFISECFRQVGSTSFCLSIFTLTTLEMGDSALSGEERFWHHLVFGANLAWLWLSVLMVTSTRKLTFAVGITQETPGCIACDTLSEKVWMLICCNDKITADADLSCCIVCAASLLIWCVGRRRICSDIWSGWRDNQQLNFHLSQ